jgi:Lrp/AsnC family leucine-responsive transcriptional regulator
MEHLERLIDEIIPYATTNTTIIQSSPVPQRLPTLEDLPTS